MYVSTQQSETGADGHSHRWNSLELVKGSYGPSELVNDVAEIKFDRPVPIKVCICSLPQFAFKHLSVDDFGKFLKDDNP